MSKTNSHMDFLVPCEERLPEWDPAPPQNSTPIALTFSGGGFRATFAAMGAIRYLADAGRLGDVRVVSSVSGGSIANAMLAKAWPKLRSAEFTASAVDEHVIEPVRSKVADKSFATNLALNAWKALGEETRTDVLADELADWFIGDIKMVDLDEQVRWVINGANLATGTRFTFERTRIGDYINGFAPMPADISVAQSVAASAAVPGPFSPVTLDDVDLPCRDKYQDSVAVMDGGIYDNTGLEVIDDNSGDSDRYDNYFSVSAAVGGVLEVGPYDGVPIIRHLLRSNSVLYRQSRNLRTRDMIRRFKLDERQGVLFKLDTTISDKVRDRPSLVEFETKYREESEHDDKHLALIKTTFDEFARPLSGALTRRGWWLTGALAATWHPDELPLPPGTTAPK